MQRKLKLYTFVCLKECLEQSSFKMLVFPCASLDNCNCNISLCKFQAVAYMNFTSLQEKLLRNLPVSSCKTVGRYQMSLIKKGLHKVLTNFFLISISLATVLCLGFRLLFGFGFCFVFFLINKTWEWFSKENR